MADDWLMANEVSLNIDKTNFITFHLPQKVKGNIVKLMISKAPAKRSQHVNATYRNIVGRIMLRAFGHPVAMCCDMLGVVGSSLKLVKFGPTTPNTSQHVATGWPNARNMLRPTMLRYVELACCDRLAGA